MLAEATAVTDAIAGAEAVVDVAAAAVEAAVEAVPFADEDA